MHIHEEVKLLIQLREKSWK